LITFVNMLVGWFYTPEHVPALTPPPHLTFPNIVKFSWTLCCIFNSSTTKVKLLSHYWIRGVKPWHSFP
jgi:hypothetical protein